MTTAIQSFNKLATPKQLEMINTQAIFLCERYFLSRRVSLFYLNGFYVEVWMDTYRNEIRKILPFTTTLCLTAYLDLINIDDAFDYAS